MNLKFYEVDSEYIKYLREYYKKTTFNYEN